MQTIRKAIEAQPRVDCANRPRQAASSALDPQLATETARHRKLGLSDETMLAQLELMLVARRLSERALKLANQGRLPVSIPSDGHEAAQLGSILALRPRDVVHLFYRSAPAALARGMSPLELLLDHFGRAEAPSSGGRQMPGHWSRADLNLFTVSSSVGTHLPTAVGTALASKLRGLDQVSIAYFGDGASSKADFHQALSFARTLSLPVIFFCENNRYAISVPFERQSSVPAVAERARGYGLPGITIDGMDLLAVYQATREALERGRRGEGASLIEAQVYRFSLHTSQVGAESYRSRQEIETARQRDPVILLRRYLQHHGLLSDGHLRDLEEQVQRTIHEAVVSAEKAAEPVGSRQ